jgi:hypothetical protein
MTSPIGLRPGQKRRAIAWLITTTRREPSTSS